MRATLAACALTFLTVLFAHPRPAEAGCRQYFKDKGELLCVDFQTESCVVEAKMVGVDGRVQNADSLLQNLPQDVCSIEDEKKMEALSARATSSRPSITPEICVPDRHGKCS
jgi:hypothetical protein